MIYLGINSHFLCKNIEIACDNLDGFKIGDLIVYRDEEKKDEIGNIVYSSNLSRLSEEMKESYSILRKATLNDIQKMEANDDIGKEALKICTEKIQEHKLDMNLMKAIYSFDGSKINFIFTSEDRVDFRDLVKDLAKHFQKQIHLQQIGPRDKAKIVQGFGKCGQAVCCGRFINKLHSISMEMVRMQNMTNKGSEKLSGCCGKLMCCLAFEVEEYKRLREEFPPLRSIVETAEGKGEIIGIDVFNNKLKLLVDDADKNTKIIKLEDIKKVISKPKKHVVEQPLSEDEKIMES